MSALKNGIGMPFLRKVGDHLILIRQRGGPMRNRAAALCCFTLECGTGG